MPSGTVPGDQGREWLTGHLARKTKKDDVTGAARGRKVNKSATWAQSTVAVKGRRATFQLVDWLKPSEREKHAHLVIGIQGFHHFCTSSHRSNTCLQIARRFELKTILCEEKTWIPKYKGPTETSPYVWQEDKASVCRESGPVVVTMADAGPTDDTMGTGSRPGTPVHEQE
jgi:hypothetical protein